MIKYQDLPEERKEQERQKYREHGLNYDWWEGVYDYAKETAAKFGLDIEDISFSGFWSQGDGACFSGDFRFKPCVVAELPEDVRGIYRTLHGVDSLLKIIDTRYWMPIITVTHSGRYSHEYSMQFDIFISDYGIYAVDVLLDAKTKDIEEALRDYARWIYRTLEKEYEYLTSDEYIDEQLHDEEYEDEQEITR